MDTERPSGSSDNNLKSWLKKLGVAGFLFFLVKGLVWLGIFAWAGKCAMG